MLFSCYQCVLQNFDLKSWVVQLEPLFTIRALKQHRGSIIRFQS